jgi:hypothetical protein
MSTSFDGHFERRLLDALREVHDSIGADRATLEVTQPDDQHGLIIALRPLLPNRAEVIVHVETDEHLNLNLGQAIQTELLGSRKEGSEALVERLVEIAKAVAAGQFTEKVWCHGGDVLKAKGSLDLGGRTLRFHYRQLLLSGLLRPSTQREYRYLPYASTSSDAAPTRNP